MCLTQGEELHSACCDGRQKDAQIVLKKGADPNWKNWVSTVYTH